MLIITFVMSLLTELLMESYTGNESFYQSHGWAVSIPLIISAVLCWFIGKSLNKSTGRILIVKDTGEEIHQKGGRHRFFFIKMEYWAVILIIAEIVMLFQ